MIIDHAIVVLIMFLHYLINFQIGDFFSDFFHGGHNVFFGNFAFTICVKLMENFTQLFGMGIVFQLKGSGQKLSIADLVMPEIINFINDIIKFVFRDS